MSISLFCASRPALWLFLVLFLTGILPPARAWSDTPSRGNPIDMNQRPVWGEVAAEDLGWTEFTHGPAR